MGILRTFGHIVICILKGLLALTCLLCKILLGSLKILTGIFLMVLQIFLILVHVGTPD